MKKVYLKRPKRNFLVQLIAEYDHYPASRILFRGNAVIVGMDEIVDQETFEKEKQQGKISAAKEKHADIIAEWERGMTWKQWVEKTGRHQIGAWSSIEGLKRLGIIE